MEKTPGDCTVDFTKNIIKSQIASKPSVNLPVEEVDFPRGGGSQLSAYEHVRARIEGAKQAENEISSAKSLKNFQSKKRCLDSSAPDRSKLKKLQKDPSSPSFHETLRIEHLNHRRLIPGIKVAGLIIEIRPLEIIVSLPFHLLGHIPITNISSYYTKRLEEAVEDEDKSEVSNRLDNESVSATMLKGIDELFKVGQWIRCSVLETSTGSTKPSIRLPAHVRAALRVTLTVDPIHLNFGLVKSDLVSGITLDGAVKSVEDKGYILDLGIPLESNSSISSSSGLTRNITGFVLFSDASRASGEDHEDLFTRWEIGQVVSCRINKMSENGLTCSISIHKEDISRSVLSSANNIDSILPLHLITCSITAIIPDEGLNVKFLGSFNGTIDISHIPLVKSGLPLEEKFVIGQKLRARVLWDTIPARTHEINDDSGVLLGPKVFSLSLLDHVISMEFPGLPKDQVVFCEKPVARIDQISRYSVGHIFPEVCVRRVAENWGLHVVCANNSEDIRGRKTPGSQSETLGFVHISDISDSHLNSLSSSSGPYKINTIHKARVTGIAPVDGALQLSLNPTVIEQRFMRIEDIDVGEVVVGTVKHLTSTGLFVYVEGCTTDCVVWPNHYSDLKLKQPERKFKKGSTIRGRVWHRDFEKDRVVLTLRKTFLKSDLPIITSYREAQVGMITYAMIRKVSEKYMTVEFFGQTKGMVPISEAAEAFTSSMTQLFEPEKLVRVRIISVDIDRNLVMASVKQALDGNEDEKFDAKLSVGDSVLASVREISSATVLLDIRRHGPSSEAQKSTIGLIGLSYLAQRHQISKEEMRNRLQRGDNLSDLSVIFKDDKRNTLIVGYGDRKNISSKLMYSSFKLGESVSGIISSIHEKNLVLRLQRNDSNSNQEFTAQGLLSLLALAKIRGVKVDELKLQLKVGDQISNLAVTQKNEDRGLIIVGSPWMKDEGSANVDTSVSYAAPTVGAHVVGNIIKTHDNNLMLFLKEENTKKPISGKGIVSLEKMEKYRKSTDQELIDLSPGNLICDLIIKKIIPEKELSLLGFRTSHLNFLAPVCSDIQVFLGSSATGTVLSIHDKHIIVSLQFEEKLQEEHKNCPLGLLSLKDLGIHRKEKVDSVKEKISDGDTIHKLIVKKIGKEKGLVILGFENGNSPTQALTYGLSQGLVEPEMGKLIEVVVLNKEKQRVKVEPVVKLFSGWSYFIDFPDINDDYNQEIAFGKGDSIKCSVVHVDRPNSKIFLSTRHSILNQSQNDLVDHSVKDRRISSKKDLKRGDIIRGFVYKIRPRTGLVVKIGTNLTAKAKVKYLFPKEVADWPSKFEVGQVVTGEIYLPTKNKKDIYLSLKASSTLNQLSLKDLKVGQVVLTSIRKIEKYGIFLQIDKSRISGLCHISEISDDKDHSKNDWAKKYTDGMKLKASIVKVDLEKQRVNFSLKPSIHGEQNDFLGSTSLCPNLDEITDDESSDSETSSRSSESVERHESKEAGHRRRNTNQEDTSGSFNLLKSSLPSQGFCWSVKKLKFEEDEGKKDADSENEMIDQSSDGDLAKTESQTNQKFESLENDCKSVDELEKLLFKSPSSAQLWIKLLSHYVQMADIPQARETATRALNAIHYREEGEKWKVWIALLNLENMYGTEEKMSKTLSEAAILNDTKTVWLKVAEIFSLSGKLEKAEELYEKTVKKFGQSSKAWCLYGSFCLQNRRGTQAGDLLSRSLKSLPARKHIKTITKFAQLEFKNDGDIERGRTLFEGLVATYPKRLDLWNVYIDQEVKVKSHVEVIRALFMRMTSLKQNPKRTKSVFRKWLQYEKRNGNEKGEKEVIERAKNYVESLVESTNKFVEEAEDVLHEDDEGNN
ncbi:hypothetical protein BY996DRAFT_4590878 [Phakopsora pachyrhizi]|uniref:S1 motif domain-containing protein n=1 Tax=Phakopsora pachyrhizi TaxID=170000 RepID=A0AAV0AFK7_PHAPC|nr:hypothetical protein BY996DRAFT_4590878 [Phakopsora pachyrhizi]CAH7665869.1 hypothetical protein PPACK8108_LOCUS163 [Phakopsora pachyrhizi]